MALQPIQRGNYPTIDRLLVRPIYSGPRYYAEFVEIAEIGAGAFGKVYKVLNKHDETYYAIKQVELKSTVSRNIARVSKETWIHAQLDHPNVVPYKAAWFEFGDGPETSGSEGSSSSDGKDCNSERSDSGRGFDQNQLQSLPPAGCGVRVAIAEEEKDNPSHSISLGVKESSGVQGIDTDSTDTGDSTDGTGNKNRICSYNARSGILYIQMALCDLTLGDWLEEHPKQEKAPPPQVITEILIEIFKGLNYMHSRNIVHHDIKPANILVCRTEPLMVQLADFGLACHFKGNQSNEKHGSKGTPRFTAPEQLRGECNIQSDVYSAGIVLLGLLTPTITGMEQAKLLEVLRKGQVPTDLPADYLGLFQLVSRLVQKDPGNRPTTEQVMSTLKDLMIADVEK